MKEYIQKLSTRKSLSLGEAEDAITKIFTQATDTQIGAFLLALKMKGETIEEIAGFAKGMKKAANTISPKVKGTLVDTCGTGGDASNTINISTAAAIIAASTGIPVAKHGNFSITSKSGSADVLKALGIKIDLEPKKVEETIEKVGIGFMLAPVFHPSMKRVAQPRRELGIRTIFNILGPLTNPANAEAQVIGVFDKNLCVTLARVLSILGTKRGLVVHGSGMDEISNIDETLVEEVNNSVITEYVLTPEKMGFERAQLRDISGGTPEENAEAIIEILKGCEGPKRDIVVMNAAAAIYVGGGAKDLREGIEKAVQAIDSGAALRKLQDFVGAAGDPKVLEKFLIR